MKTQQLRKNREKWGRPQVFENRIVNKRTEIRGGKKGAKMEGVSLNVDESNTDIN
jgi:hypothetical protein